MIPTKNFEIDSVVATYTQEGDEQSPNGGDNFITFESEGINFEMNYFVIKTERWAFDNIEEMVALLEDFKKRIAPATNNLVKPKDD